MRRTCSHLDRLPRVQDAGIGVFMGGAWRVPLGTVT
jgi:hypothetical protein